MYENLAVLAVFGVLFSIFASRVERSAISGPMVYILFGLLAGPLALGLLDLQVEATEMRVIADLTLALVLFLDASTADLRVLRQYSNIPIRMLSIGFPLCILLGGLLALWVLPELSIWEAFLLATMLAATDAALGKAVVTNEAVPNPVRQGLNAESGLNDGLAVPFLFVFLALATGTATEQQSLELAMRFVAEEIAQSLHGSGFIACFVGGLLFGYFAREHTHHLVMAGEGIGELLAMVTWVVFGAVFMGRFWSDMTWDVVAYSLLSLTVIRMLPMLLALLGTDESLEHRLFLAWFGPRGLASIVFMVIVAGENLPGESIMVHVVVCTITLCIVAHGVTANPWASRLARQASPP